MPSPLADAADAKSARKKFVNKLTYGLLDYRHHTLANLHKCVEVLLAVCSNVVKEPGDARFRKVRASNKRIAAAFSAHPAAPELLHIAGWRTKVEELERYWTFDAPAGSQGMELLQFAVEQLQKVLDELEAKQSAIGFDKKAADAVERDKVLRSIEEDRNEYQEKLARQRAAAADPPAPPAADVPPAAEAPPAADVPPATDEM